MTRPRTSTSRELYGIIGKLLDRSAVQAAWNQHFEEQGLDAFMDYYPTTVENLPERLSEMFHFDRRVYLVGKELQERIESLLDVTSSTPVNCVVNESGILIGHNVGSFNFQSVGALVQSVS